jgi:hypothetical protein
MEVQLDKPACCIQQLAQHSALLNRVKRMYNQLPVPVPALIFFRRRTFLLAQDQAETKCTERDMTPQNRKAVNLGGQEMGARIMLAYIMIVYFSPGAQALIRLQGDSV